MTAHLSAIATFIQYELSAAQAVIATNRAPPPLAAPLRRQLVRNRKAPARIETARVDVDRARPGLESSRPTASRAASLRQQNGAILCLHDGAWYPYNPDISPTLEAVEAHCSRHFSPAFPLSKQ